MEWCSAVDFSQFVCVSFLTRVVQFMELMIWIRCLLRETYKMCKAVSSIRILWKLVSQFQLFSQNCGFISQFRPFPELGLYISQFYFFLRIGILYLAITTCFFRTGILYHNSDFSQNWDYISCNSNFLRIEISYHVIPTFFSELGFYISQFLLFSQNCNYISQLWFFFFFSLRIKNSFLAIPTFFLRITFFNVSQFLLF